MHAESTKRIGADLDAVPAVPSTIRARAASQVAADLVVVNGINQWAPERTHQPPRLTTAASALLSRSASCLAFVTASSLWQLSTLD